jgi:hypothetical protein
VQLKKILTGIALVASFEIVEEMVCVYDSNVLLCKL